MTGLGAEMKENDKTAQSPVVFISGTQSAENR